MANPISTLGIIHTVISIVPIFVGLYSFIRYHKIDIHRTSGRTYLISLVLTVVTAFGLSSTGGLNAGHAFGMFTLLVAFGSQFVGKFTFIGKLRPYIATFGLSFSFFLSLVPGTNETLTRLPAAQPLAQSPSSPIVLNTLSILFILFIVGFITQCWQIFLSHRNTVVKT